MNTPALEAIGWNPHFDAQLADEERAGAGIVARVSAHHGSEVVLHGEEGEFRVPVRCADAAGRVIVGDWVVLNPADQRATRRLERRTLLSRTSAGSELTPQGIAANVDTAFIVSSCTEDFSLSRIERYLAMILPSGAEPVVVLTKADECDDPSALVAQVEPLHPGLTVVALDARRPEQARVLHRWCGPGQSVALLGSSGVGKSSLANALGAGGVATGAVRAHDGKGRHTTTSRSLHQLPTGGVMVDNPGVREFQLPEGDDGVDDLFEDVLELAAACRFSDCGHDTEPGCAIRRAIDAGELDARRFANYRKLLEEQARLAQRLEAGRQRERAMAQRYEAAKARKRRNRGDR